MSENTTKTPEEQGKKRFEVKMRSDGSGGIEKAIFIDDEVLDWQIDTNSFMDAMRMGPQYMRAVQQSIETHFVESVSDFLGRKVTMIEIKEAIKNGWI